MGHPLWMPACTTSQCMFPYLEKAEPPSDDKRWKIVATAMRKLGNQRQALIEALHSMQQTFGYLDEPGLVYVAAVLRLPLSRVYGAASFYHHFTMKPPGRHTCVVCTGTACYIKGGPALLDSLRQDQGAKPGQTTHDGELSVLTARCFGTCGLAPVAVIDEEIKSFLTPETLQRALAQLRSRKGAPADAHR